MENQRIRRSGFTIVELLTVISIVGILSLLLFPALQSIRLQARLSQCHNNLRQLGIAALSHESTFGFFPSGGWGLDWFGIKDLGHGLRQPGGWFFNSLDYLDDHNLRDLAPSFSNFEDYGQDSYDIFFQAESSVLQCPSKLRRPENREFHNVQPSQKIHLLRPADLDYCANAGNFPFFSFKGPDVLAGGDPPGFVWPGREHSNGMVGIHDLIRVRDISDGLSNTLLIGEKYGRRLRQNDAGDNQTCWQGFGADIARWTLETPLPDDKEPGGNPMLFGSSHPSVTPFVIADGSTKNISFEISRTVFYNFGSRDDSNTVPSL